MEQKSKKQGFGTMSPERRKEIASMGGRAAQTPQIILCKSCAKNGKEIGCNKCGYVIKAHRWNSETARKAGARGGRPSHKKYVELEK